MNKYAFSAMAPLVIFTSLLPAAIGLELGAALAVFLSAEPRTALLSTLGWSLTLTVLGVAFVSMHLGKKARGIYAMRGIGHSFLSWESVFSFCFGLFLFLAFVLIVFSKFELFISPLLIISALFGLMMATTIGKVYDLPSQVTWRGLIPSLGPLMAVFLFAGVTLIALIDIPGAQRAFVIFLTIILIVDLVFSMLKMKTYVLLQNRRYILVYPQFQKWVIPGYLAKMILPICAIVALLASINELLIYFISLTVLLDRITFYLAAAQLTPAATISILKAQRMSAALNDTRNRGS